jgi:hypothetical protein
MAPWDQSNPSQPSLLDLLTASAWAPPNLRLFGDGVAASGWDRFPLASSASTRGPDAESASASNRASPANVLSNGGAIAASDVPLDGPGAAPISWESFPLAQPATEILASSHLAPFSSSAEAGGAGTSALPHTPIVAERSEQPLAPPPLAPPPVAPRPAVRPPPISLPLWQRIAAAPVGLTSALATAILLGSTIRTAKREDDEFHPQYVIRGGISAPRSLQDNTANLAPLRMPNEYGMSSSTAPPPMKPEDILAVPKYPGNRQYSYTILPELTALGYRLEPTPTRDNPLHSSILLAPGQTQLTEAQAKALSAIFRRKPNPYFDPSYVRPR